MLKIIFGLVLLTLNVAGWVTIYETSNQLLNGVARPSIIVSDISVIIPTATVTADALNMRDTPSANGKLIITLKQGDRLTITGDIQNDWLPVEINGTRGFVNSSFVSLDGK